MISSSLATFGVVLGWGTLLEPEACCAEDGSISIEDEGLGDGLGVGEGGVRTLPCASTGKIVTLGGVCSLGFAISSTKRGGNVGYGEGVASGG